MYLTGIVADDVSDISLAACIIRGFEEQKKHVQNSINSNQKIIFLPEMKCHVWNPTEAVLVGTAS